MTDDVHIIKTSEPELMVDHPSKTGEGPLWHEESRRLYWVDIPAGTVFRFDPDSMTNEKVYQHDGMIGGYTIQADGSLVLFGDNGAIFHLNGDETEPIIPEIDAVRGSRFNDVIADAEGRVYAGTMPIDGDTAHLYRLDPDGSLTLVYDDLTQSNGMAFRPDLNTMYLTDSRSRQIFRMDYDRRSGELSNRATVITTPDDGTVPDGMMVDSDGTIWSARYGGGGVFRYSPEGELLGKVEIPVRNVTSGTFGGPHYDRAYITTAGGDSRSAENGMYAGSLFRVDLKATGRAPFPSRIGM